MEAPGHMPSFGSCWGPFGVHFGVSGLKEGRESGLVWQPLLPPTLMNGISVSVTSGLMCPLKSLGSVTG